jgi:hypothetical protein
VIVMGRGMRWLLLGNACESRCVHSTRWAIAITSVILAARGIDWRRKILYAVIALGGFVAFDRLFDALGLTERMSGFGFESVGTALGLIYIVATYTYPLAVLVVVTGRDPSVLWTRPVESTEVLTQESTVPHD